MSKLEQDIDEVLKKFSAMPTTVQQSSGEEDQEPTNIYHIFPTEDGEGISVYREETLVQQQPPDFVVPDVADDTPPIHPNPVPKFDRAAAGIVLVLMAVVVTFMLSQAITVLFLQTATVSIVAAEKNVTTTQTIQLVIGIPSSPGQLQARMLTPVTLTQKGTAPATGTFHQSSTYAIGYVTFYNGSFSQQFVAGGTILTGKDGVLISTTQDAVVPGVDPSAYPPSLGYVTVTAKATNIGSNGNIGAFDINGACCRDNVQVKNTQAFTGGQDAKDFQIITQADINKLSPLQDQVKGAVSAALASQVRPNETLITDSCSPRESTDHKAGDIATQVTVTVTESCGGMSYNSQALQTSVSNALAQQTVSTLGKGYSLLGPITVTPAQIVHINRSTLLKVTASGQYGYLFSESQQQQLKRLIAGKSITKAQKALLSRPGFSHVSISGLLTTTLPTDIGRIHLLILYVAS